MKSPHILLAGGNVTKLKNNLIRVIDANAIQAIENEINLNTKKLYILGKTHFLFESDRIEMRGVKNSRDCTMVDIMSPDLFAFVSEIQC